MKWTSLASAGQPEAWAAHLNLGDTTVRLGVEEHPDGHGGKWRWWVDGDRRAVEVEGTADEIEDAQCFAERFAASIAAHTRPAPRASVRVVELGEGEDVHV